MGFLRRVFRPEIKPEELRLGLEITHLCNKQCELCDHRIRFSSYDYLRMEEYEYIRDCIEPTSLKAFTIVGGEPLCHPQFEELMLRMLNDFPGKTIAVWTNGKLLPSISDPTFRRLRFVATRYPGFNDAAYSRFRHADNVRWRPAKHFWNPYRDPSLDEPEARMLYKNCDRKRKIRVVETRLYGCCLAESIERYYQTEPVHVRFTSNWISDVKQLPTWKACQHCFRGCT